MNFFDKFQKDIEVMQKDARKQGIKDTLETLEESTNIFLKAMTEGNENLRPGLEMMLVVIDGLKKAHCGEESQVVGNKDIQHVLGMDKIERW